MTATVLALACGGSGSGQPVASDWRTIAAGALEIEYAAADASVAPQVLEFAASAPQAIEAFFLESMGRGYRVRLFPDGGSLAQYWRTAWNQPAFQRQCWMVAAAGAEEVQIRHRVCAAGCVRK